jgi:hypothetical protein
MTEGVLGACCRCGFTVKQAAIATTWNAWSGFSVFDDEGNRTNFNAAVPSYATVSTTETWARGDGSGIFASGPQTQHVIWRWYGVIGNAGWTSDLDQATVRQILTDWGRGQGGGCGCVTLDAGSETHFGDNYDGSKDSHCVTSPGCIDIQHSFDIDLSDKVDWRNPSISFDVERAALDSVDWSLIPNEWTGVADYTGFFTDGVNPPEIPSGDITKLIGRGVGGRIVFAPNPGLFTINGDVASARVLCGPDKDYNGCFVYGANADSPPGLNPSLNPPAIAPCVQTGREAPSLYRGFVVRTRIENADSFCSVEFDQIGAQCGDDGIGLNYAIGPCKKGVIGPILYEPLSMGLILASFDNKYPCCR